MKTGTIVRFVSPIDYSRPERQRSIDEAECLDRISLGLLSFPVLTTSSHLHQIFDINLSYSYEFSVSPFSQITSHLRCKFFFIDLVIMYWTCQLHFDLVPITSRNSSPPPVPAPLPVPISRPFRITSILSPSLEAPGCLGPFYRYRSSARQTELRPVRCRRVGDVRRI